jgi:hypothetical protein
MQVGFNTPKGQAYVEDPENVYGPDVLANCQYNEPCATTQYPTVPDNNASHIYAGAECAMNPCQPSGTGVNASVAVYRATIIMQNNSTPTGSAFEGALSSSAPVSGVQDLKFVASDPGGPGVYNVSATVDGTQVYNQTPSGDGATCVNQGQVAEGYSFLSETPCSSSISVNIAVDTGALSDGTHSIKVIVTDAASNASVVFDKSITTTNAPVVTSPPSISGAAQVGITLTGSNAVFMARSGLGPLGQVADQWLRCSSSNGTGCSVIAGATSASYTPTAGDHGYAIEYENSVEDAYHHKATSISSPTVAVAEAPGSSGNCAGGACQSAGNSGNGGSAGSGGNGAGSGAGTNSAGATTGITVNLSNPLASGSSPLGGAAKWSVSLQISPHKVRRRSTIKLTGRVATSPRPSNGKLILLQARSKSAIWKASGHRHRKVTVYGKWVTFQALRAKSNGTFASTYKFRLGGRHTYQFQAVAPAEGQYRNPTGGIL